MKKGVFYLLVLTTCCSGFAQPGNKVPPEIKKFVLKGYEVLDYTAGDLNRDKRPDAILILKIAGEDTILTENYKDPKRPMLLLVRQENGTLKQAARNDAIVMCRECGGIYGDPYESMSVDSNTFSIHFYGGSAWRWSYRHTFRYNAQQKNWLLYEESDDAYWNVDPDKTFSSATTAEDELNTVSFAQYKPLDLDSVKEKHWKVISDKAYFYDYASRTGKPLKAYLLKGDKISSYRETKNFVLTEYENKAGKTTRGFIKRADLVQIKGEK